MKLRYSHTDRAFVTEDNKIVREAVLSCCKLSVTRTYPKGCPKGIIEGLIDGEDLGLDQPDQLQRVVPGATGWLLARPVRHIDYAELLVISGSNCWMMVKGDE